VTFSRDSRPRTQFVLALLLASLASICLFLGAAYRNRSWEFAYLIWNLFLAWLPLIFAGWLVSVLRRKRWSAWEPIAASLLWIVFLPNSFYMVSDFIHLRDVQRVDVLYDAVMFTSFIFIGVALGLCSTFLIHEQFRRRYSALLGTIWLGTVFLLCSFAIYLGRDLRWNSWDILTNPGGLLFDISDRFMHLSTYPQMLLTVLIFLVFISTLYGLTYKAVQLIRQAA
jgi:uncharacterized membrane protein